MKTYTFRPTAEANLKSQIAEFMIAVIVTGQLFNSMYLHSPRLKRWIEKQAEFYKLGFYDGEYQSGNFDFSFKNGILSVTPKTPYAEYMTIYINEMQTEKKEWKSVVLFLFTLLTVIDDEAETPDNGDMR